MIQKKGEGVTFLTYRTGLDTPDRCLALLEIITTTIISLFLLLLLLLLNYLYYLLLSCYYYYLLQLCQWSGGDTRFKAEGISKALREALPVQHSPHPSCTPLGPL